MRFRWALPIVVFSVILAGCTGTPAIFNPAGMIAVKEADLFRTILWMSLPVFLVVDGGILLMIIRDRRRRGDTTEPAQVFGNRRIEIIWTAIPIGLVIALFVLTVVTMQAVAAPSPSSSDVKVTVVGHRWWWEFDYPDLGIKTANELHIPAGKAVQISLESVDVIHSFWVPQLAGKTDVVPGITNYMWLTSDKPGVYQGQCSEFCGTEHGDMRLQVFVDTPAAFQAWVTAQQALPAAPTGALAQQGQKLVTTGVCTGCHTINGTNMKGAVGPNLTHLFSRTTFAGSSYVLNDQNLTAWLTDPNALKPGNLMSVVHINPQDIPAIIAYLHTLK